MNIFSGQSPKATEIKAKINQWDLIKLTRFCTWKETKKKTKRRLTEWEKIVLNDETDKGGLNLWNNLNLYSSTAKKPTTQWKNGQKTWIDIFPRKMHRWPTSTWKNAQYHWLLEKCKSKLPWDTTSHKSEWPSLVSPQRTNARGGVEKKEPSCTVGGNVSWYIHYGEQYEGTLEIDT